MFKVLHNSLFSLLYPQDCRVCSCHIEDVDDGAACARCWAETRLFTGSELLCAKCGAFFHETADRVEVYCRKCDDHFYDKAAAVGVYEKAVAATIIKLKTEPVLDGRARRSLAAAFEKSGFGDADLVIPIPLAPKRFAERGFNQAEVLAAVISELSCARLDSHSLARTAYSPIHRVAMDRKARELSVKNAFVVKRPKLIDGRSVLLVDDVFTSGATSSYCAKVLKKNGAARVNVLTFGRAVMH